MSYLLRIVLPDRPGALGAVASAIGTSGADIVSVDIVDKHDHVVIDDIVIDMGPGQMPDEVLSAAQRLDGVHVESIRPFDGALSTHRELQLLEAMSVDPEGSAQLLVDELPRIFRSGWGIIVRDDGLVMTSSASAPENDRAEPWRQPADAVILDPITDALPADWTTLDTALMAVPYGENRSVVAGRPGGPDFRPSELSRLAHLVGITRSIWLRYVKAKKAQGSS
ncbi:ACT domain-containing protein [Cumulibacter soli]|uniref:ACT domain-containing protein n=1 Tax=Cumulibacter soli TaxID=2546344 RepID=UPI0010673830|nr:ACT domain-containing protein [Cumulibacter soli]